MKINKLNFLAFFQMGNPPELLQKSIASPPLRAGIQENNMNWIFSSIKMAPLAWRLIPWFGKKLKDTVFDKYDRGR